MLLARVRLPPGASMVMLPPLVVRTLREAVSMSPSNDAPARRVAKAAWASSYSWVVAGSRRMANNTSSAARACCSSERDSKSCPLGAAKPLPTYVSIKASKSRLLPDRPIAGPPFGPEIPAITTRSAPVAGRNGFRERPTLVMPVPVPSIKFGPLPSKMSPAARTSRVPGPLIWMSPASARVVTTNPDASVIVVLDAGSTTKFPKAALVAIARRGEFSLKRTMSPPAETIEMSSSDTF
jgi:hypothetical protein